MGLKKVFKSKNRGAGLVALQMTLAIGIVPYYLKDIKVKSQFLLLNCIETEFKSSRNLQMFEIWQLQQTKRTY